MPERMYLVSVTSHDVVEVEASNMAEARQLVEDEGARDFRSVWYESEVTSVKRAPKQ